MHSGDQRVVPGTGLRSNRVPGFRVAACESNVYQGGILAVVILLLFLKSVRTVLIIGLSIPISVIATFMFVKIFGRSINVISLAGMAFAVGMVADNAITVLENIYRHFQMGKSHAKRLCREHRSLGRCSGRDSGHDCRLRSRDLCAGQAGQLFRDTRSRSPVPLGSQ